LPSLSCFGHFRPSTDLEMRSFSNKKASAYQA
jgi:hypothetical protein